MKEKSTGFFSGVINFSENGQMKNMDFLYSFGLSLVLFASVFFMEYGVSSVLHAAFGLTMTTGHTVLTVFLTSLFTAFVYFALYHVIKKKRVVLLSCFTSDGMLAIVSILMVVILGVDSFRMLFPVLLCILIIPTAIGTVLVSFLMHHDKKKRSSFNY